MYSNLGFCRVKSVNHTKDYPKFPHPLHAQASNKLSNFTQLPITNTIINDED